MTAPVQSANSPSRLGRLLGFLQHDPDNIQLLADAAAEALDEGALEEASQLLDRYEAISPLPAPLLNLRGLVSLGRGRFDEACEAFQGVLAHGNDNPMVRFNLAWSKAMIRDYEGALALLDETVVAAAPRAAALRIQTLHHLGRLEDALAFGLGFAELYPHDADLMGALAIVAIDAEEIELARAYALKAGDSHEGLSTLGMLNLNEQRVDESLTFFNRALITNPNSARAQLGKGLGLLTKGDPDAAEHIDRAAEIFGGHLGSWVAAGWAYFVQGNYAASRERFERALALNDTFAETHGGLAVLDIVEGRTESARRRTEVALRLDRKCFAGALARMLMLTSEGDTATAERIRDIALTTSIGGSGRTIAQAMVGVSMAGRKNSDTP